MKLAITGISGGLGQKVARLLTEKDHQVIGIDPRPWPNRPNRVQLYPVDIRKRAAEDVFRKERPGSSHSHGHGDTSHGTKKSKIPN